MSTANIDHFAVLKSSVLRRISAVVLLAFLVAVWKCNKGRNLAN